MVEVSRGAKMIKHLSHSQITSFTMCPRKWHYEKVENAPREKTPSCLVFGCAVHDALAAVNEAALYKETIDAQEEFYKAWIQHADCVVHYGKDSAADLQVKGRELVKLYKPPENILGVEQPFSVMLDEALPPVEGRIDLIYQTDAGLTLADIKTSSSKVLADTNSIEAQLSLYDIAYPAANHQAIVLGKLKTPTLTFQDITPQDKSKLRQHYIEVYHAMISGVRYTVRGWQCEGCSFSNRCRKDG